MIASSHTPAICTTSACPVVIGQESIFVEANLRLFHLLCEALFARCKASTQREAAARAIASLVEKMEKQMELCPPINDEAFYDCYASAEENAVAHYGADTPNEAAAWNVIDVLRNNDVPPSAAVLLLDLLAHHEKAPPLAADWLARWRGAIDEATEELDAAEQFVLLMRLAEWLAAPAATPTETQFVVAMRSKGFVPRFGLFLDPQYAGPYVEVLAGDAVSLAHARSVGLLLREQPRSNGLVAVYPVSSDVRLPSRGGVA